MPNILANTKTLVSTPGMLNIYSKWILSRRLLGKNPAVSCTSNTSVSGWLNFSEYWSFSKGIPQAEELLMEKCLSNSSNQKTVTIDIGANIGLFTVTLASLGYSEIHAFEPVPQTFSRLETNIKTNQLQDKITLNCVAVGSEEGTIQFQIFEDSPAINRFVKFQDEDKENIVIQKVALTTLSKYCDEHSIQHIDFLKIDVEGMELFVLKGGEKLLRDHRIAKILLEICPNNLQSANVKLRDLYEYILEVKYLPYYLEKNGDMGKVLKLEDLEKINLANIVLAPDF